MMISRSKIFLLFLFFIFPNFSHADLYISEVMYDLEGSDEGREWVEVFNESNSSIPISEIRFREAEVNHKLVPFDDGLVIEPNTYFVIVDNIDNFKSDNPNFSQLLVDSSFSLSNTGETLEIRRGDLVLDSISYNSSLGANGDGNSLSRVGNSFKPSPKTPGVANLSESVVPKKMNSDIAQTTFSSVERVQDFPKIYAEAGNDREVVVGVLSTFEGLAYGSEREPLSNATYHWNMGDGIIKSGKNISHIYEYPGKYVVSLEVISGEYSQGDTLLVNAIVPDISIISFLSGDSGYIEIRNDDSKNVDISGLSIVSGNSKFYFPKGSKIFAKSSVKFPNSNTKILGIDYPFLQYENGKKIESSKVTKETASKDVVQASAKIALAKTPEVEFRETMPLTASLNDRESDFSEMNEIVTSSSGPQDFYVYLFLVFILSVISILVFYFEKKTREEKNPFDIEADEYDIVSKNN